MPTGDPCACGKGMMGACRVCSSQEFASTFSSRPLAVGVGPALAQISAWVDDHPDNADRDGEARTWGRIAKVGEEFGEVIAAYIGATGQNPRKGVTHGLGDVEKELLDVALTALCAVEHLTGNEGASVRLFDEHVRAVHERSMASFRSTEDES